MRSNGVNSGGLDASIAYVIDPRFPGGTSSAVARELAVVAGLGLPMRVFAIGSKMFTGRIPAPVLEEALSALGLHLEWDPPVISADRIILHNPAFLKFDQTFSTRLLAREIVLVTHENFMRPGDVVAFDVATCLDLIDRNSLASRKLLAPVSTVNRGSVERWLRLYGDDRPWALAPDDWFNICDFEMMPPVPIPSDRRGRHSRPGYEKFPALDAMDVCFPPHAQSNVILGADTLIDEKLNRPHWEMIRFRSIPVSSFLDRVDFIVYFTAPLWRESFGRVLAEAIAAGKVVISDAQTASTFGGGVVAARPEEVDTVIGSFLADPVRYGMQVRSAQKQIASFSSARFLEMFLSRSRCEKETAA
jgi:hypothetical protein